MALKIVRKTFFAYLLWSPVPVTQATVPEVAHPNKYATENVCYTSTRSRQARADRHSGIRSPQE